MPFFTGASTFTVEKPTAKATSRSSNVIDVRDDVASTVLKTLQVAVGCSPAPGLAEAVNLALEITPMVQTVKGNKAGFEELADKSRKLAYVMFCANQNGEDVPPELEKKLDHALWVLREVKAFAEKCSSRNSILAFMQSETDAEQTRRYLEVLKQCLDTLPDNSLRVMKRKLVAQQEKILEMLENKDKVEPNGQLKGSSPDHITTPGSPSAKFVSGSDISDGGGSPGRWAGMKKNTATNDSSVNMGRTITFTGASGYNFGSNNVNSMSWSS